jgi:hypothetical protein
MSIYNDKLQNTSNEVHKPPQSQGFDDNVLQYWYSWNDYGIKGCSSFFNCHAHLFGSD